MHDQHRSGGGVRQGRGGLGVSGHGHDLDTVAAAATCFVARRRRGRCNVHSARHRYDARRARIADQRRAVQLQHRLQHFPHTRHGQRPRGMNSGPALHFRIDDVVLLEDVTHHDLHDFDQIGVVEIQRDLATLIPHPGFGGRLHELAGTEFDEAAIVPGLTLRRSGGRGRWHRPLNGTVLRPAFGISGDCRSG